MLRRFICSHLKTLAASSISRSSSPVSAVAVSLFSRRFSTQSDDIGAIKNKVEDVMLITTDHEREELQAELEARSKCQHHSAAIQVPTGLEDGFKGLVDLVMLKAYYLHGSNGEKVVGEEVPADMEALVSEKRRELREIVSQIDDKLAEAFFSDKPISAADLEERTKCQRHIAAIQVPTGLEDDFMGLVDLVQLKAYYFHGSNGEKVVAEEVPADMEALGSEKRRELTEIASQVDDKLAEDFFSDKPISAADLEARSNCQRQIAAIQVPTGLEDDFTGLVDLVLLRTYYLHGSNGEKVFAEEVPADMEAFVSAKRCELMEIVSQVYDNLAEAFFSCKAISAADLESNRVIFGRMFCSEPNSDVRNLARWIEILPCKSNVDGGVSRVYLIGTRHRTKESREEVHLVVRHLKPDLIFLELCMERAAKMPLKSEFLTALLAAKASSLEDTNYHPKVVYGDMNIQDFYTLRRKAYFEAWLKNPGRPKEEIQREVYDTFIIDERNRLMMNKIKNLTRDYSLILAVVGRKHLAGMKELWREWPESILEDIMLEGDEKVDSGSLEGEGKTKSGTMDCSSKHSD